MKERLIGKTLEELRQVAAQVGLPRFAASQIARWLYVSKVRFIDDMTNISLSGRAALSERYEVGITPYSEVKQSADGTKKYLFPVVGLPSSVPSAVETVMIPSEDRHTICVSSQAGCKMNCSFCMTGRQGFHGNLSTADIISQFLSIEESECLTNAVFMGMGEPLDNYDNVLKATEILTSDWGFAWSPKRVTVSTIGVQSGLERFLEESKCHLAVSLHSPFADERARLMPMQKAFPADEIISMIKKYDFSGQRRVSFEYIMFGGLNDDRAHADALSKMLKGIECRVNLIRFHKIPDAPYQTSSELAIAAFKSRLEKNGIVTTVRASRGEDIFAACGMLAGRNNGNRRSADNTIRKNRKEK